MKLNHVGEILVKGPGIGYSLQKQMPNEFILKRLTDSWPETGDLGEIIDGQLYFRGRMGSEINCGGYKFAAEEVEQCILEIPQVSECAVIGFPDERLYQVPVAYVASKEISTREIRQHLAKFLAPYKIPKSIHISPSLPAGAIGKIARTQLSRHDY